MTTRGAYTVKYKNESIHVYNQYDSYISGLGQNIFHFISVHRTKSMIRIFKSLMPIPEYGLVLKSYPTFNLLDFKSSANYYVPTDEKFINSVFCEFYYVIDIDNKMFEIFTTKFSKNQDKQGKLISVSFKYIRQNNVYDFYNLTDKKYILLTALHEI